MKMVITGNHTVSYAAKLARVEVIAAYPITPQTEIVEKLSSMVADGELDAKFIKVESEHSAMSACIGASATGCRAFTATSSQGLALMHEMLHWAANARLPVVMANVNRAMATPWNVWADQTDSLAQRDTGWLQFYCESNQEILDTTIQAFKICEKVCLPGMVMLDAFFLSHTSEVVDLPDQKLVDEFLPKFKPKFKLDPEDPRAFGGLLKPDGYYEFRYKIQKSMEQAKELVREVGEEFGKKFGRPYDLVERYRCEDAEILLITSGTIASTAKDTVDLMRKKDKRVGLARVRVFRPFPKEQIREVVKPAKMVGVIDRNISFGSEGIFFSEVKSALCNEAKRPPIYGFIAGLGGRDVLIEDIEEIVDSMPGEAPSDIIWFGLKR